MVKFLSPLLSVTTCLVIPVFPVPRTSLQAIVGFLVLTSSLAKVFNVVSAKLILVSPMTISLILPVTFAVPCVFYMVVIASPLIITVLCMSATFVPSPVAFFVMVVVSLAFSALLIDFTTTSDIVLVPVAVWVPVSFSRVLRLLCPSWLFSSLVLQIIFVEQHVVPAAPKILL